MFLIEFHMTVIQKNMTDVTINVPFTVLQYKDTSTSISSSSAADATRVGVCQNERWEQQKGNTQQQVHQ
jgi:hypothetical protein